MFIEYNPNPEKRNVGDCAVRAISKALNITWETAYAILATYGYKMADIMNSNAVIDAVLIDHGYNRYQISNICQICYTIKDFCREFPDGEYVVCTGNHVVTIINGNVYDAWDSSREIPVIVWKRR